MIHLKPPGLRIEVSAIHHDLHISDLFDDVYHVEVALDPLL